MGDQPASLNRAWCGCGAARLGTLVRRRVMLRTHAALTPSLIARMLSMLALFSFPAHQPSVERPAPIAEDSLAYTGNSSQRARIKAGRKTRNGVVVAVGVAVGMGVGGRIRPTLRTGSARRSATKTASLQVS